LQGRITVYELLWGRTPVTPYALSIQSAAWGAQGSSRVLLFDNWPHRLDHSFPFSRALEIDPATKAIVWKYQEARVADFFSPRLSNAQRLPNGNTLINEGWFGRFFEVTRDGSVVWEYVNPYFGVREHFHVNAVQRAYRYSVEQIAKAHASG
jgi:hypothetical protein